MPKQRTLMVNGYGQLVNKALLYFIVGVNEKDLRFVTIGLANQNGQNVGPSNLKSTIKSRIGVLDRPKAAAAGQFGRVNHGHPVTCEVRPTPNFGLGKYSGTI